MPSGVGVVTFAFAPFDAPGLRIPPFARGTIGTMSGFLTFIVLAMSGPSRPLRTEWSRLRYGGPGLQRVRLFPEELETVSITLKGRTTYTVAVCDIVRADLVVRHKKTTSRLQVRLKNGKRLILRVRAPVLWKKAINELVGAPWNRPSSSPR